MSQIPDHLGDVGPGWRDLLMGLHGRLLGVEPGYTVAQVKEKFGCLRVYADVADALNREFDDRAREFYAAIDYAGHASASICEACGQPGELYDMSGWVKTYCAAHGAYGELVKLRRSRETREA
jgi:hypothetical protein